MSLYATCRCGVPEGQEGAHRTDCPLYGAMSMNDIAATSDRLARRMGGRFVVKEPAGDPRLWCLHHIGADEVHPAPDFETAWKWATWANERFADAADICRFTVSVWPWSADQHAADLAASIADWTLPATQEDAARAMSDLQRLGQEYDGEAVRAFKLGDRVYKKSGSSWRGKVVGFYSTALTPVGYAVESDTESGSVQIYPEKALAALPSHKGAGE